MRVLFLVIGLSLATGCSRAQAVDEAKPYGRACVTVVDAAAKTEALFTAGTPPGPERFVTVHLDASAPCEALVAAFAKKDGRLAFGWRSAMLALPEWEEQPVGEQHWAWKSAAEPFEVFVLFFAPGSADAAQLKKLVAAMQEPKSEAQPSEVAGVLRGASLPWRKSARARNFTTEQPGVLIFPSTPAK